MNKHRGEINLNVGDRIYTLKFTTNSIVLLEEALGKSVNKIGDDVGVKELRAMIWAGLQHNHPEITLDKVGEIIDEIGTEYGFDRINEAISFAFPEDVGGNDSKKKEPVTTEKNQD